MVAPHVVVAGAGIGGLTAGALLLQAGYRVTVLEAHVDPGGSAATFYHKGYRFDAGATLAGGFAPGGPHRRLGEILGLDWPVQRIDPAWVVHLPGGRAITQWAGAGDWQAERREAFPGSERFWQRQETLAAVAWGVAGRPFPWPPASARDWLALAAALRPSTLRALPYLTGTIAGLAPPDPTLRTFLDAQLLISAQTTAEQANALYGSAALDLPRRGVYQVRGGIGTLAQTLAGWIKQNGGEIHFRQEVEAILVRNGRAVAVRTKRGLELTADWIVANVTPWALHDLLGAAAPAGLRRELKSRPPTWGAFVVYLGLDASQIPPGAGHHQIVVDASQPLGEGNSVFVSLSPAGDESRAPAGQRAATLSTHTAVAPWWALRDGPDAAAYEARKEQYTERLLSAAERALPGLRQAVTFAMPGTPVSFASFTRRPWGMAGGFPQTSLFAARGPGTGIANLLLAGDSVFPGQSTAGVTLGAMRVAAAVIHASGPFRLPVPDLLRPVAAGSR
jgi:C-3',4' desaturase CrtD